MGLGADSPGLPKPSSRYFCRSRSRTHRTETTKIITANQTSAAAKPTMTNAKTVDPGRCGLDQARTDSQVASARATTTMAHVITLTPRIAISSRRDGLRTGLRDGSITPRRDLFLSLIHISEPTRLLRIS